MAQQSGKDQQCPDAFARKLQRQFARAPDAAAALRSEDELGPRSIKYQLSRKGAQRLFRALHNQRKAQERAAREADHADL